MLSIEFWLSLEPIVEVSQASIAENPGSSQEEALKSRKALKSSILDRISLARMTTVGQKRRLASPSMMEYLPGVGFQEQGCKEIRPLRDASVLFTGRAFGYGARYFPPEFFIDKKTLNGNILSNIKCRLFFLPLICFILSYPFSP
jgi:hypothetical protein